MLRILPRKLDLNSAPEQLAPDAARALQNIDIDYLAGRMRRGAGYQRSQVSAVASFDVRSCFVAVRSDCTRILFYGDTGGVEQATPGDGSTNCSGPLPDWAGGTGVGT